MLKNIIVVFCSLFLLLGKVDAQFVKLSTQWKGENMVLGIENGQVMLKPWTNNADQIWKIVPQANNHFRIVNKLFGEDYSIDLYKDKQGYFRPQLVKKGNFTGQYWKLVKLENDNYYRMSSMWQGEDMVLDIQNAGEQRSPWLAPKGNYTGQFWKITTVTDEEAKSTGNDVASTQGTPADCKLAAGAWMIGDVYYDLKAGGRVTLYKGKDMGNWSCNGSTAVKVNISGKGNYAFHVLNEGKKMISANAASQGLNVRRMTKQQKQLVKLGQQAAEALQKLNKK